MLEEVDVLVDDIEPELGQVGTRRAVTVEGFPEGEVARDVSKGSRPSTRRRGSCSRRVLPYILQQKV